MAGHVPPELVGIALERIEGVPFERFAQDFLSAVLGSKFIPLGGMKDKGADAALESVFEGEKPDRFMQASIEQDFRGKIKSTVNKLRKAGREVSVIIYATPHSVRLLDLEEDSLTTDLGVVVRIRDGAYIKSHINDGPATRAAFENHLRTVTSFLTQLGGVPLIAQSPHVSSPAVYVFLRQELERQSGDVSLLEAVTDGLILWALEGTDPDQGLFMDEPQIAAKIYAEIPAARQLLKDLIRPRLEALSRKEHPTGREVRWHKKEDKFVLPYETRSRIAEENAKDESLRLSVIAILERRIAEALVREFAVDVTRRAAEVALRAVQRTFEREGLEFAGFLEHHAIGEELPSVGDALRDAMEELKFLGGSQRTEFLEAMLEALRGSFFSSTPEERNYFGKLSRTYALLFTLKTEPRLVRFFEEMASDFYLYVGADVFVRALSERYLPAEDQKARVMLRMAREAGATLVLAEPVLDEVVNHLRTCDVEYRNYYEFAEGHVTLEIAREAPKILLRAYLYARINPVLEGKDPRSWEAFVNQFCDFATLNKPPAFEQMRRYLTAEFGIEFVSAGEIDKLVDLGEVEELADALKGAKSFAKLAVNDAKLALAVYGRRTGFNEIAKESEFGYRTWWLTSETTILKHTKHLVEGQEGARYMMRPDFLLNFMALAPSAASVRQTYANVFPSVLGVKLAKRMNETVVHEMLKTAKEAAELEPGRRAAKIADLADKLKSDFSKRYIEGFGPTS